MSDKNILGMTDEEFAKLPGPPEVPPAAAETKTQPEEEPEGGITEETVETPVGEQEGTQTAEETDPEEKETPKKEEDSKPKEEEETAPTAEAETDPKPKKDEEPPKKEENKEERPKEEKPQTETPDYEAFYKRVMAPFKANGKLIQLTSPDEVITLMQMGANYTKKMQAIQPYKKYLMMLENSNLLDEEKLSFLIDVHQKNPEAIKKLLKESNIDPVDIDTSGDLNYKGGTHKVTDQEAALATAIDELKAMNGGLETLQSVNQWDSTSKKILWEQPEVLQVIHSQRENGIYDIITTEMERRQALGGIPAGAPFLPTYKQIGDELNSKGAFQQITRPTSQAPQQPAGRTPVAVRPQGSNPAKPTADNPKVRAAAPPRTAPRKTGGEKINPLAMSDEEFMKMASKV